MRAARCVHGFGFGGPKLMCVVLCGCSRRYNIAFSNDEVITFDAQCDLNPSLEFGDELHMRELEDEK